MHLLYLDTEALKGWAWQGCINCIMLYHNKYSSWSNVVALLNTKLRLEQVIKCLRSWGQGQHQFHLPNHWWCCLPVERLPKPLHLTLPSLCDTIALTISCAGCRLDAFSCCSWMCASHRQTQPRPKATLLLTSKKIWLQTQFLSQCLKLPRKRKWDLSYCTSSVVMAKLMGIL